MTLNNRTGMSIDECIAAARSFGAADDRCGGAADDMAFTPRPNTYWQDAGYGICHIFRNVYLSDCEYTAKNVEYHNITRILNITDADTAPDSEAIRKVCDYRWVRREDDARVELPLAELADYIGAGVDRGDSVLVHCHAGVSRSPTAVIAWLMKHCDLRLEAAYELVKERRPIVYINFGFFAQLVRFELRLAAAGHDWMPELETRQKYD